MEKYIEVKHVSKAFKGENVLEDINLELYDDHIYGFVGRNGSGKSVLFKLICGYMYPNLGEIIVRGKKIGKDVDFPENLGALIENPGFLWHESGLSNLVYLAKIAGKISKEDVKEAIKRVGLDPNSKKHVGKYSLGMKQRLGLAGALLGRPPILILDEPTNGLDPSGIHEIRNLVKSLPTLYDCTVLISSHMLSEIELMADDIGILNHGRLLFEGSLDELRRNALQAGFAADNLEEMFLSMIDNDNTTRKQRATL